MSYAFAPRPPDDDPDRPPDPSPPDPPFAPAEWPPPDAGPMLDGDSPPARLRPEPTDADRLGRRLGATPVGAVPGSPWPTGDAGRRRLASRWRRGHRTHGAEGIPLETTLRDRLRRMLGLAALALAAVAVVVTLTGPSAPGPLPTEPPPPAALPSPGGTVDPAAGAAATADAAPLGPVVIGGDPDPSAPPRTPRSRPRRRSAGAVGTRPRAPHPARASTHTPPAPPAAHATAPTPRAIPQVAPPPPPVAPAAPADGRSDHAPADDPGAPTGGIEDFSPAG